MAACTNAISGGTFSTLNQATYASGAFTPAASDLLVVGIMWSATTAGATPTLTSSVGGQTFTLAKAKVADNSGTAVAIFVCDQLATAVSQTVTAGNLGSVPTGCGIMPCRVSGMTKVSSAAVLQANAWDKATDAGSSTTPQVTLPSATLTTNPVLVFGVDVGNNPSAITKPSASWTQQVASGYATPTEGGSYSTIDSGYTTAGVTSGGTVTGRWQYGAIELDSSGGGGGGESQQGWLDLTGCGA